MLASVSTTLARCQDFARFLKRIGPVANCRLRAASLPLTSCPLIASSELQAPRPRACSQNRQQGASLPGRGRETSWSSAMRDFGDDAEAVELVPIEEDEAALVIHRE